MSYSRLSFLFKSVTIITDSAPLSLNSSFRLASVKPLSIMSSTIITSLPFTSLSRSFLMLSFPDETAPEPYDETAIKSSSTGTVR